MLEIEVEMEMEIEGSERKWNGDRGISLLERRGEERRGDWFEVVRDLRREEVVVWIFDAKEGGKEGRKGVSEWVLLKVR